jgi:VIT1/CCC1 family predicted Fe2+/Mn2+ transporter
VTRQAGIVRPMRQKPPGQLVRGVLTPLDRASELLFGLIMALTVTGALEIAQPTERDTRALFASTLACNIAWGLVDAVMYALNGMLARARRSLVARTLRDSPDPAQIPELLAEVLPEPFVKTLGAAELEAMRRKVVAHPALPEPPRVHGEDLLGGAGVFLLVVAGTFPVALPFLLFRDVTVAKAVSRGLALLLLFLCGYAVGRYSGLGPVRMGLLMLGLGAVLVGVVTALGG